MTTPPSWGADVVDSPPMNLPTAVRKALTMTADGAFIYTPVFGEGGLHSFDYWIEDGQFQLTYLLNDRTRSRDIGVRLRLPRDDARMESIHDLWPTAATYQRELREMFGIDFPGSPRVDEDFILEGWTDIPPYRREFDTLQFARETYPERPGRSTHDPAQFMKKRLYPDGE